MNFCPSWLYNLSLSEFADIAQVVIAAINLFLAGYILFYQIRKDRKSDNQTAQLHEQNIKLQWFKELILQPSLPAINTFYKNLGGIKSKITSNDLTIQEREAINDFVKNELAKVRKSFIDVLLQVDPEFAKHTLKNLDDLIDGITEAIFDDELKLVLTSVYEKNIGTKISYSRNTLIAQLYNYKGISKS